MTIARLFPVFSVVFAVFYVLEVKVMEYGLNLAAITYQPRFVVWQLGAQPPLNGGPAMYWWGWIITAAFVAVIATVIAGFVPETVRAKFWPGLTWAIPLACMVTVAYVIRGFFI
jgi:hypothetical protein